MIVERLVAERAQAMPVAEVRRTGQRHALLGGPLQPQQRSTHEQVGRHQVLAHAGIHHHQVEADQPHVVRERHPAERNVLLAEPGRLRRAFGIGQDVAVGQHHALGLAGGARRELDERRLPGHERRAGAGTRDVFERVDQESTRGERRPGVGFAGRRREGRQPVAQLPVGVEIRATELPRDAQQLVLVLVADAHRDGHGHDAAVQAGPVGIDELLVARHVQHEEVAGLCAEPLQVEQDAEGPLAQVGQLERLFSAFAFEIDDGAPAERAFVEHVRERRVLDHRYLVLVAVARAAATALREMYANACRASTGWRFAGCRCSLRRSDPAGPWRGQSAAG